MAEEEPVAQVNGHGNDSDDEDDPPPGEGLSEEIFEVETILEHLEDADNVMFYKVRWKNYGPSDDSWEPAENLESSAGKAIKAYWAEMNANPEKSKPKKKTTPKKVNGAGSSKRGSRSRRRPPKESRRSKSSRRTKSPAEEEPEDESEPDNKSSSDDDDYDEDKKNKKSRPVSKGALKSFETPKKSNKRGETPMNSARRTALEHRQGWLFDNDSDSDDDEAKQEKEGSAEANDEKTEEQQPESSDKLKRDKREDKKRRREQSDDESESTPKERRPKEPKPEIEETPEQDEPRVKRGKRDREQRPPTPPRASTSAGASSTTVEYINNSDEANPRKISLKIKLPPNPNAVPKPTIKPKEKSSSDILYYNQFPQHKPLNEIGELKEINLVEGVMINTKGGWVVFVRDVAGTCCMLTAEEAYERCGWILVQYLLARAKFA